MKSIVLNEKERESIKKSDIIKYAMLRLATPIGLIISCVLAYLNIDFIELLKIFSENISNPEVLNILAQTTGNWYIISFIMVLAVLLLLVIYLACNKKRSEEDAFTWGKLYFLRLS